MRFVPEHSKFCCHFVSHTFLTLVKTVSQWFVTYWRLIFWHFWECLWIVFHVKTYCVISQKVLGEYYPFLYETLPNVLVFYPYQNIVDSSSGLYIGAQSLQGTKVSSLANILCIFNDNLAMRANYAWMSMKTMSSMWQLLGYSISKFGPNSLRIDWDIKEMATSFH